MQVTFNIKDIQPFPTLPDPTMLFPTIYFENQLYAAKVPYTTFSEGTFCQTSATIQFSEDPCVIIEKLLHKSFYVVLNSICPGKKAKKPADGISYPELNLIPFSASSEIKINPLIGEVQDNYLTQKLQLELQVFTNSQILIDVDFKILDYKQLNLYPFQFAIGGIQIPGNLKNVKANNYKGFVPCNYEAEVVLPNNKKLVLTNGYFSTIKNEIPQEINNMDDILAIAQPQFNYINFPQITSFVDNQLADQSFMSLYQVIGDAKGFEKAKQADFQLYQQKFGQFSNQALKQSDFADILNILKEAVGSSFTQAILIYNENVISQNTDPKKKIDPKNFVQQINFNIETMPTFLQTEQFSNNYSIFLFNQEEVAQLRENLDKKANIQIKVSEFWKNLDVPIEDFECICEMDFTDILRKEVIESDIKLQMTPEQTEKANTPIEVDPKDKKKVQAPYQNMITSNYGLIGLSFSFKNTNIIRTDAQIIQSINSSLIPPNKLILQNKTFLTKRMTLDTFLPPSQDSMTPKEQVCYKLREDVKEAYARATSQNLAQVLQPFVKKYLNQLDQVLPHASLAEKHSLIMSNSQQAIQQLNIDEKHPTELINFGNTLLQSQNIQDAQRAQTLFGQALTRERRSKSKNDHTVLLEQAVLGGLKCAIISKNTQLLMRSLIRTYSLSQIKNESKLHLFELAMLSAAELVALGENPEFALSFLHFYKQIYNFEVQEQQQDVVNNILIKTLSYCLLEILQNKIYKELELILTDYVRKVNSEGQFFSAISEIDSDELIIVNLKLALCEWLILRGSSRFASIILQNMQNEFQITHKTENKSKFKYNFDDNYKQENQTVSTQFQPLADQKRHFHIIQTKSALLSARILYIEGYFSEMRNVLIKQLYQQKQPKTTENNPLKLLSYLQSDETISASFLDLIEPILDQVPGVLTSLALSCAQVHKVPQFLKFEGKLPQIIVCGAIQGRLPNKQNLAISTANSTTNTNLDHSKSYTTSTKKKLVPDQMLIPSELSTQLSDLTFQNTIFNSKIAYHISLQALSLSAQTTSFLGYSGLLDCKTFSIDVTNDSTFVFALSRLAIRYLPLLDLVPFPRPFSAPSEDEISVAKRIFHQIQPNCSVFEPKFIKNQLTTDYLAEIQLKNPVEILEILTTLTANFIQDSYQNPRQLAVSGMLFLYQNDYTTALSAFQRVLQLDSTESVAWRGIALILAHQLTVEADLGVQSQIRMKITECINRAQIAPSGEISVAIAQALLSPNDEKATYYALIAAKMLKNVTGLPQLVPIVAFQDQFYDIELDGSRSSESAWYVNRLLAIANMSCGRPEDVAGCLQSALKGLGGIKPGRSVIEIAERILIMTETVQAWEDAGESQNGEKVMAEGLM